MSGFREGGRRGGAGGRRVNHQVFIADTGITQFAPEGMTQEGDIFEVTKALVTKYIASEEMVILAVVPATSDF